MPSNNAFFIAILAVTSGLLAGCAPWPAEVGGGLAERYEIRDYALRKLSRRHEHVLHNGGKRHFPARMVQIRLRINRAIREHAAGLYADAQASADEANDMLDAVEEALGDVAH